MANMTMFRTLKLLIFNIIVLLSYNIVQWYFIWPKKIGLLYKNTETFGTNSSISTKSIIMVGMLKNSAKSITSMLHSLDVISCHYHRSIIMIYESNSRDSSPETLLKWSSQNYSSSCNNELHERILLKPLIDPAHGADIETREDRYVIYRNYLLNESISINQRMSTGFDYYAIFDDVMSINHLSIVEEMTEMSKIENRFDVICANGQKTNMMWDSLAAIFMNDSWAFTDPIGRQEIFENNRILVNEIIIKNKFTQMKSCFGGMAFYKNVNRLIEIQCKYLPYNVALETYPILNKYLWYKVKDKKHRPELCEHFAFNLCLGENGFTLAVDRDMLLYYD